MTYYHLDVDKKATSFWESNLIINLAGSNIRLFNDCMNLDLLAQMRHFSRHY